jgi:hypothetical protein
MPLSDPLHQENQIATNRVIVSGEQAELKPVSISFLGPHAIYHDV